MVVVFFGFLLDLSVINQFKNSDQTAFVGLNRFERKRTLHGAVC